MDFLNTKELAERWGVSELTLKNWRSMRKGPAFYKKGYFVLYKMSDILKYEKRNKPVRVVCKG